MANERPRSIFSRLVRSVFLIFTGYFALLGVLVTTVSLLIAVGVYKKLKNDDTQAETPARKAAASASLDDSIVRITLENGVSSSEISDRAKFFSQIFGGEFPAQLQDLEITLRRAAEDNRVHAILLDMENGGGDFVTITALRRALVKFEESKKPVYVHINEGDTLPYYLASVGTKVNLAPISGLTLPGPAFQLTYFSSALKKLGVEMEVVRAGKYKSAMEAFVLDQPSPETLEMYNSMESSLRGHVVEGISAGRKKPKEEVDGWLKRSLFTSQQSLQKGLVDRLGYLPEWIEEIKQEAKATNIVSYEKYLRETEKMDDKLEAPKMGSGKQPALAMIEASGEIVMGGSNGETTGRIVPKELIKELQWAADQDEVKAVIFRIDSPGGSALASDLIWNEVRKLREKKPVIVSMGTVAASGGYYIAAPATMIVAEPTTITGSIGVIGAVPKGLQIADKWGVSFHIVTESDRRNYLNFGTKSTEADKQILGESIEETYNAFVRKVAEGRKQDPQHIYAIAQGRVYTGAEALRLGLVDKLGGLTEAVREAKIAAKLDPDKLYPLDHYQPDDENLLDCLTAGNAWNCLKDFKSGASARIAELSGEPKLLSGPLKTLREVEGLLGDSKVLAYWPGHVVWSEGEER